MRHADQGSELKGNVDGALAERPVVVVPPEVVFEVVMDADDLLAVTAPSSLNPAVH